MALQVVANKLKKLFLVLLGLIKRSLCCFKRRRRLSCESIPLTGVATGSSYDVQNTDVESWAWEEPVRVVSDPNSVQHHIEMYRQQAAGLRNQPENEEEEKTDFFEDMTPKITKQPKLLLRPQNYDQESSGLSRLNFAPEVIPKLGPELGSWEENEHQGSSWEDAESWDAAQLVREKRKAERERHGRSTLGLKVS